MSEARAEVETDPRANASDNDYDTHRAGEIQNMGTEDVECQHERSGERRCPTICLYTSATTLAPIITVSGLTADHGDSWKLVFVGLFVLWLGMISIGLYLDLRQLDQMTLIKRSLWHAGCCIAMLYFFMSILHLSSENLPQWVPTIIDSGLGISLGLQRIPSTSLQRLREYAIEFTTSICGGGAQIHFSQTAGPALSHYQPRSRPSSDETNP